jgi:hypothetical protein
MNMTNLLDQITNTVEGEWDVRQANGVPAMAFYYRRPRGLYAAWTDAQLDQRSDDTVKVTFYVSGMSAGTFNVHTLEEATDLFAKHYAR